jgi:hypothetical protein
MIAFKTNDKYAIDVFIDDEDADKVLPYRWFAWVKNGQLKSIKRHLPGHRGQTQHMLSLHRAVFNGNPQFIDHIDRNPANNVKANLRPATRAENNRNGKERKNQSGYRGVSWLSRLHKWQAKICVDYKQIYLGIYDTAEEAYCAYLAAAKKYHGAYSGVA